MKAVSTISIAVVSVLLVAGCAGDDAPGQGTVRFGAVIDQTGSIARPQWVDAAQLAIDHANDGLQMAGGFNGLNFDLEVSDSNNLVDVAVQRALELRELGVKGIVTDTSETTLAIWRTVYDGDSMNDVALPTICMACTAPSIGRPDAAHPSPTTERALRNLEGWGFRAVAHSGPETVALMQSFLTDLPNRGDTNGDGQQKIAIEVINDLGGNEFFADLRDARDALFPGVILERVSHEREIDVDGHNWNEDLNRLSNDRNEGSFGGRVDGKPDALLEVTFPLYAASLTRSYLEAGRAVSSIPFVHHHSWRNDQILIKLSAFDLEGQEGVSHAIVDNCETSGATFADAFAARLGREPGFLDSQTYDAVMAMALATLVAVRDHGLGDPREMTRLQLRDAMHSISDKGSSTSVVAGAEGFAQAVEVVREGGAIDYDGASGPMDFDDNGNVVGNFVKYRVEDGRFVDYRTYDCVADSTCPLREGACNP